jgi:hypothetical protein
MTLREYAAPLRAMPVDTLGTEDVLAVLSDRLRMRGGAVQIGAAVIHGGDVDEANPWPDGRNRTAHEALPE